MFCLRTCLLRTQTVYRIFEKVRLQAFKWMLYEMALYKYSYVRRQHSFVSTFCVDLSKYAEHIKMSCYKDTSKSHAENLCVPVLVQGISKIVGI